MTEISKLLAAAKARLDAMTPEERAAMWEAQRQSWVRGEQGMGETAALAKPSASPLADRDERQRQVHAWCAAAFGADHASSIPQRAVRLLEEAIEAYQAADADPAMAHKLVDFVFGRPVGNLAQELGGIGLTLLALAQAAGASADAEEARELARVLSKPLAQFKARNEAKNAAGFNVTGAYCAPKIGGAKAAE